MSLIQQLNSVGAIVSEGFDPATVEWTPKLGDKPIVFEISVKKEESVADFEFINMTAIAEDNRSVMARSIHRLVRFHSVGGNKAEQEQLPLEDCYQLKPGLLLALFVKIGNAKKPQAPATKPRARRKPTAKTSARKTNSGAS